MACLVERSTRMGVTCAIADDSSNLAREDLNRQPIGFEPHLSSTDQQTNSYAIITDDNNSTTNHIICPRVEGTETMQELISEEGGVTREFLGRGTRFFPVINLHDLNRNLTEQIVRCPDELLDELRSMIERTSSFLNLPQDPHRWSCDQVQSWARWILKQYNLHVAYAKDFKSLDGVALCQMNKNDLQSHSPAGEFIHAELEIWKNVYKLQLYIAHSPSFEVERPVYLDLSNSTPTIHPTRTNLFFPSVCETANESQSHNRQSNANLNPPCHSISPVPDVVMIAGSSSTRSSPVQVSPKRNRRRNHTKATFNSESTCFDTTSPSSNSSSREEIAAINSNCQPLPPPSSTTSTSRRRCKRTIHLWQFLKELLQQPQSFQSCIRWLDRAKGIFKIEDFVLVAKLWGQRKNRPAMNYDKLSRSIRQYYKKNIIKKTNQSKRLVYQLCSQYL